jgi:capsular polysaccharide biosynthesis protein
MLAGLAVLKDFKDIIQSRSLLTQVKDELSNEQPWIINQSIQDINKKINIDIQNDKRLLRVNIEDVNPGHAAILANKIAEVFQKYILSITNENMVTKIEVAKVPSAPFEPRPLYNTLLSALVGFMLSIITIFIEINLTKRSQITPWHDL